MARKVAKFSDKVTKMANVEWLLLNADLVGRSVSQSSLMAEPKRTVADY